MTQNLSKKDGLDEMANVNLYDGSQTLDETVVISTNDFNKEKSNAGYDEANNDIYLNIDKTDMTNSTEVVKATLHEQERHTQSQNGDTDTLSLNSQTELSKARGERASTVWDDYSDLAGIETKSSTTQTTWNTNNQNSKPVSSGTSKIATVDSKEVKPYTLTDIQMSKDLDPNISDINTRTKAMLKAGYSKEEIEQKLSNDSEYKTLTKNGDSLFDKMYDEQKTKVASENKLIDNTTFALEVSSSAVLAGTATVPFAEKMLKKEVSATVAGAVAAGAIDVGIQYTSQIIEQAYDNDFDMDKVNYTDFTVDATSLGTSIGTGSVVLPIIKDGVNSVVRSTIASQEYKKQILNSNTINKVSKLKEQKDVHDKYVQVVLGVEAGNELLPPLIDEVKDLVNGEE